VRVAARTAQAIAAESGEQRAVAVRETASGTICTRPVRPDRDGLGDKVDLLNRTTSLPGATIRASRMYSPPSVSSKAGLIVSSTGLALGDVQPWSG
jgi:hypothetical protein